MRDAHMRRTQSQRCEAKHVNRRKGSTSSVIGVSHFSRRTKRRLYYKLQLWMWRKRQEKCRLAIFRAKKENRGSSSGSCLSVRTRPQKKHTPRQSGGLSYSQKVGTEERASAGIQTTETRQTLLSPNTEDVAPTGDIIDPGSHSHTIKPTLSSDSDACKFTTHLREPRTLDQPPRFEVDGAVEQLSTVPPCRPTSHPTHTNLKELTRNIYEFLDDFYRIYGSFIPLQKRDVLKHLKRKFNTEFTDRKNSIFPEVAKYQSAIMQKAVPSFQVVYRKHTLTLDDLSTLADQNWLNDQVMNMYGELIMDSSDHKVHFLNSFFHRQLMTKGYDGVKRWTKQVDLFSKSLLLVPIHLEVHWCLVAADNIRKKICLYDSQGNALQKVARNILKYLMAEAKERKQTAFENGWILSFDEKIPQQTNENDCGVFVLEYSRRLALGKPLQFSQKDIPKIRKRIYKELCDCKVHVC